MFELAVEISTQFTYERTAYILYISNGEYFRLNMSILILENLSNLDNQFRCSLYKNNYQKLYLTAKQSFYKKRICLSKLLKIH